MPLQDLERTATTATTATYLLQRRINPSSKQEMKKLENKTKKFWQVVRAHSGLGLPGIPAAT